MATVSAFQITGAKAWFWSDDHDPPHFHVKRTNEWEVRVTFLLEEKDMIEVKWANRKPGKKVLKEITSLAKKHRVALLKQWEEIHHKPESES